MNAGFEFDPFSVKSLLVQAVEHVIGSVQREMITPQLLTKMTNDLNEIIGLALQPYDSPPSHPWDFDFRFAHVTNGDSLIRKQTLIQVINKAGEVVLEWEN